MTDPALIERITRSLAFMLRHQPESFDLELDPFGFADLEDVVHALNERLGEPVEVEDVQEAVRSGDRPRYEVQGDKIRALYGHSIPVEPGPSAKPPEFLYVAVPEQELERARRFGLRGGRRRFLHLAITKEDAAESGRRAARDYTVLVVRALDAWEEGISFYDRTALWLAEEVPTHLLEAEGTYHDGTDPIPRYHEGQREHGRDRGEREHRHGRGRGRGRGRDRDRYHERREHRGGGHGHGGGRAVQGGPAEEHARSGEPGEGREREAHERESPQRETYERAAHGGGPGGEGGGRRGRGRHGREREGGREREPAYAGQRPPERRERREDHEDRREPRREERPEHREDRREERHERQEPRTSGGSSFGAGLDLKPEREPREERPAAPARPPSPPPREEPPPSDDRPGFGAGL